MLAWALCKKFCPVYFSVNPYLATFGCFLLSVASSFVLNIEFEGGLISGVVVFSTLSLIFSVLISAAVFIVKAVKARKNA